MNKLIGLVVVALSLACSLILAGYWLLGIPGALGGIVLCFGLVKGMIWYGKRKLKDLGKSLFDAKSRVLRGASATVHQVVTAPPVSGSESVTPSNNGDTKFYFVDVTISPKDLDGTTPFRSWDPNELLLISFDKSPPSLDDEATSEDDGVGCKVHEVSEVENSDDASHQRLRLHVEIPAQLRHLKFQYYFETFGDITLP